MSSWRYITDAWETHCLDQEVSDEGTREKEKERERMKEAGTGLLPSHLERLSD